MPEQSMGSDSIDLIVMAKTPEPALQKLIKGLNLKEYYYH